MSEDTKVSESTEKPARTRKPKDEGKRQLSTVQLRTMALLGDVGVATERGVYRAGVSDSTGRTLQSLLEQGYVERYIGTLLLADGREPQVYALTNSGNALLRELRDSLGALG